MTQYSNQTNRRHTFITHRWQRMKDYDMLIIFMYTDAFIFILEISDEPCTQFINFREISDECLQTTNKNRKE